MMKTLAYAILVIFSIGRLADAGENGVPMTYTANAAKAKQILDDYKYGSLYPKEVTENVPVKCTGKRYEQKLFFGSSSIRAIYIESEDLCVATCWQYRLAGNQCAAVNYIARIERCEFMKNAYEEGGRYVSLLSEYSTSTYVETIQCDQAAGKPDPAPAPVPAPAPLPVPAPIPLPQPNPSADAGSTNTIRPGSCGQSSVPQKATHSMLRRKGHQRIVGGTMTNEHSIPFIVSLRSWDFHYCGGTLIRVSEKVEESDIVITAAHCITNGKADFDVVAGAHWRRYKRPGEESVPAAKVVTHPEYDKPHGSTSHDIAIVKLSRPIKFSQTIQPACLPAQNETVPDGTNGIVAGWGKIRETGSATEMLTQVVIPTIPSQKCIEHYRVWYQTIMPDVMLCAGYDQGQKDSCKGDSGGPFFFEGKNGYTLQGVVSWGTGCARARTPGVYARVSTFIDWIKKEVKELSEIKH